jgi:alkylation response protein AidB-like acyl-CoA dehydrogenase
VLPFFEGKFGLWSKRFTNDAPVDAATLVTASLGPDELFRYFAPGQKTWSVAIAPRGTNGASYARLRVTGAEVRLKVHAPPPPR